MSTIAIITARGGSKRIPKKNIKKFCGKPIIEYSIKAALESQIFDEIMVSTDDQEILEIAKKCGASVPFLRSKETSNDFATTYDVIDEVLTNYKRLGISFNNACCLYPTAPFITAEKLKKAYTLLIENQVDTLIPIVKYGFPPQRAFVVRNGKVKYQYPEYINSRSQDLTDIYHDCGQFYFFNVEEFHKQHRLVMDNCYGMIMPEEEVQDIDNMSDWKIAELKYQLMINI